MPVVLQYYHYHQRVDAECDDIDAAVFRALVISDYGDGHPDQIVSTTGEVLVDNKAMWKLIDAKHEAETALEARARVLTDAVNQRIEDACKRESGLRWQTVAEEIADEALPSDEWEYAWYTRLAKPPRIVITRYLK